MAQKNKDTGILKKKNIEASNAVSTVASRDEDRQEDVRPSESWILQTKTFLLEVKAEFERITWPSRKETVALATSVLFLTLFFTVFLGVVDLLFSKLIRMIIY